jgi:hypothetical protein
MARECVKDCVLLLCNGAFYHYHNIIDFLQQHINNIFILMLIGDKFASSLFGREIQLFVCGHHFHFHYFFTIDFMCHLPDT